MLPASGLLVHCVELRSTMKQERLNSLMVLHVHKDLIDALDLSQVANEFVEGNDTRKQRFGKF